MSSPKSGNLTYVKVSSLKHSATAPIIKLLSHLLDRNVVWIALFALTVAVRLVHLSADPPIGLSTSQGVYTDPAAYTMYAKNDALFGSFNPQGDTRFPLFQYSAETPVARAVFAVFGVGYAQANFSALLFSLGTLLLLALLVRKRYGAAGAFFTLVFLALNRNQFFYGRLPFLENPMVFFGVLSFWMAENCRSAWLMRFFAGLALGASFLLGKSHGVVFVGVLAGFFFWRLLTAPTEERRAEWRRIFIVGSGLATGCVIWFLTVGWPNLSAIRAYLAEQSTGLYGPPEAFNSVPDFFWKLFSLGTDLHEMYVVSALAFVMLALTLYRLLTPEGGENVRTVSGVTALMTLWLVLLWLELFAWTYRPLRYQIPMAYPLAALAGISMATLWNYIKQKKRRSGSEVRQSRTEKPDMEVTKIIGAKRRISFYFLLGFLLIFPVYQIWSRISIAQTGDFSFDDKIWDVVLITLIVWAGAVGFDSWRRKSKAQSIPTAIALTALILAPGLSFGSGVAWYSDWAQRPTYTIVDTSKDLPKILGKDAVLSGPYAVGLCQDNSLEALVHQFGVSDPDTTFLDSFPVTHVLLDESNMTRFEDMYPSVVNRSFLLHTYHITNFKVRLLRISGATNNQRASEYTLSPFEVGTLALEGHLPDPSGRLVGRLKRMDSVNIAVNLYFARRSESEGNLQEAARYMGRAALASPTDYDIQAELGRINLALYNKTGEDMFRKEALERFRLAHHLNPGAEKITAAFAEVETLK